MLGRHCCKAFLGFMFFFVQTASAAITSAPVGEPCSEMVNFQGVVYVCADHPTLGKEVHIINGDRLGTTVLLDIDSGPGDSNPRAFFSIGETLYFFAENSVQGESLWKTDGTAEGTQPVRSFSQDFNVEPRSIVAKINDLHFVFAFDLSGGGLSLLQTDGTFAGTVKIDAPISQGVESSLANFASTTYAVLGNTLYLITVSNLYRVNSDATSSLVYEGLPYNPDTGPQTRLTEDTLNGQLVIRAVNEIWLSDGTPSGTQQFRGSDEQRIFHYGITNDRFVYVEDFSTLRATDGQSDIELLSLENDEIFISNTLAQPIIEGRVIFQENFSENPKLFFTGGSLNTTTQSTGTLENGYAIFDGKLYASDKAEFLNDNPVTIVQIDPITGQQQVEISNVTQLSIISDVQQGVAYTACIDECTNDQLDDRLGLWLLQANGSTTLLAALGNFDDRAVSRSHQEGQRSYYVVREGRDVTSPYVGIWHSDGTSAQTYQLSYQFDDGVTPVEPEKTGLAPSILMLLLDDEGTAK